VTVIVSTSTPAVLAARTATTTIPIVFFVAMDPVQLGLVTSLSRPGGNLTGVVTLNVEVAAKRLQLLHEFVPTTTIVALLVNPTSTVLAETTTKELETCQLARQTPDIWIDGARVPVVWDEPMAGAGRPWFECPACGRRCRYVYLRDVIACRTCHRLDYASRHLHRSVPGVHRVMRWRRMIGVDPKRNAPRRSLSQKL